MAQQDRAAGLIGSLGMKAPCRAATSVDVTLYGIQTVDGVNLASGDRVLVKAQSDPVENGIYVVGVADWERAADFDGVRDVLRGTAVVVSEGAAPNAIWALSSSGVLIGTSELTFTQVIGSGGGGGLSASAFMQTVLDDITAAAARTTLGAAALNGSSLVNFSAMSLSVSESVALPGASAVSDAGWLGLGTTDPLSWLHVSETDTADSRHTSRILRTTDHVGGSPSTIAAALAINHTVIAASLNKEYGVSTTLDTYAASSYNIAGYFLGNKRAAGNVQAGAFEAKDHTAVANPTGALNALTATIFANGTDGFSTRVGIDLISGRVNTAGAVASIYAGLRVSVTDADPAGSWYANGIILQDDIQTGILISNNGGHALYGINDSGVKNIGHEFQGTYSQGAIRIKAGQRIYFDQGNVGSLRASAADASLVGFEGCNVNFEKSIGFTGGPANITGTASGGAASALPALPSGYVKFLIDGTTYKFPYYN